ncbi:MAG: aminotransferase class V-fold PLP-dependent enzyme [Anaerolineae bacterium]
MKTSHANSESDNLTWQPAFRAEFPLLQKVSYFQTGSVAPLSNTVREAVIHTLDAEGDAGLTSPRLLENLGPQIEATRAHLAAFLGVSSTELGWTNNATMAIHYVIGSIQWQPDDVLVTSSTEHISTRTLQQGLAQRRGVRNVIVPVEEGDQPFLRSLEQTLDREHQTRLLLLSHVSCLDGRRLPVAEATRLAHAHGVPVLVDGAQAVGQFPVNISDVGCDFYAGSARKWLLGPAGLGFLYVTQARLDRFFPDFVMAPGDTPPESQEEQADSLSVARRTEIGTQSLATRAGLDAALTLLETVGLTTIERYVARLSAHLRTGLQALPGISILTPLGNQQSSGITSFTLPDNDLDHVQHAVSELGERARVVVKVQLEFPAVRVSIAAFNTQDDVERLLQGLSSLLARPHIWGKRRPTRLGSYPFPRDPGSF